MLDAILNLLQAYDVIALVAGGLMAALGTLWGFLKLRAKKTATKLDDALLDELEKLAKEKAQAGAEQK